MSASFTPESVANDLRARNVAVGKLSEASTDGEGAVHTGERMSVQIARNGGTLNVVRALRDEDGVIMYPDRKSVAELLPDLEWAREEDAVDAA